MGSKYDICLSYFICKESTLLFFELSTEQSQLQPVLNVNKCHFQKSSTKERKKEIKNEKCRALIQTYLLQNFCIYVVRQAVQEYCLLLFFSWNWNFLLHFAEKKGKDVSQCNKNDKTRGCSSSILAHQLVCGTMGYAQERDLWSSQQSSNKGNTSP